MNWASKQHPVETVVEWIAPIPLAVAAAWACWRLGLNRIEAAAAGVAALTAGFAILRYAGRKSEGLSFAFEPAAIEPVTPELEELLLDEKDELLELVDELVEVPEGSRVVKLFAREEPTPGELVDRIADFLEEGRRPAPAARVETAPPADASAALQAALANIRASLR